MPRQLSRTEAAQSVMVEAQDLSRACTVYAEDLTQLIARHQHGEPVTSADMAETWRIMRWLLLRLSGLQLHTATMVLRSQFPEMDTDPGDE